MGGGLRKIIVSNTVKSLTENIELFLQGHRVEFLDLRVKCDFSQKISPQ